MGGECREKLKCQKQYYWVESKKPLQQIEYPTAANPLVYGYKFKLNPQLPHRYDTEQPAQVPFLPKFSQMEASSISGKCDRGRSSQVGKATDEH